MNKRSFQLLCATLFVIAPLVSGAFAGNWIKFTSTAGKFSVLMPGPDEPKDQADTTYESKDVPASVPYTTHLFVQASEKGVTFLVGWVDYAPAFKFDAQKELAANRDNFAKGVQAKVVSQHDITLGQYAGIEFICETESGTVFKSRLYIVGLRPYMLIVGTPKGRDDSANMDKFFASFQVN